MNSVYVAANGGPQHKGQLNRALVKEYGYHVLPWPPQSGDLDIIENCWKTLKDALQRRWAHEGMKPRSDDTIWKDAHEEWTKIP